MWRSGLRLVRRRGRRNGRLAGVILAGCVGLCGCQPPFNDVLEGANGVQIRLTAVDKILNNPDLTEEEKRQALRDLGITDEDLIDALLNPM